MKRYYYILPVFLLFPAALFSQNIDEFRRNLRQMFESEKETQVSNFQEFKKKQWESFRIFKGEDPYEKPKVPDVPEAPPEEDQPVVDPDDKPDLPKADPDIPEDQPEDKPVDKPEDQPEDKPEEVRPPEGRKNLSTFDYYGQKMEIVLPEKVQIPSLPSPSRDSINNAIEVLSKTDYSRTIDDIKAKKEALKLNDWGAYLLIHKLAKENTRSENQRTLFTWYLMVLNGYDTKLAYSGKTLILFSSVGHKVYQTFYLKDGSKRYFAMTPEGRTRNYGSVRTYSGTYPGSSRKMDYRMKDTLFADSTETRKLKFNFEGKEYHIETPYNQNRVRFLEYYPQTEFQLYFNANVDQKTHNSLLKQLGEKIQGKNQVEAINFLLRFSQTSFQYQVDEKQFGREKPLFLEETLHYPYSDCEDRSILFAYLVRKLLKLDVVGVHYPGHLATAVRIDAELSGADTINYRGKKYFVADPTYMGANLGMAMPMYKESPYSVVPI